MNAHPGRLLLTLAAAAPISWGAALVAQEPPLIPRRILFGNPERQLPQISPDGTRLAYLAPDSGVMNVWVRTVGANDDRPVTRERTRPIRWYAWQGGSQHVIYRQDENGDENWHLYQTHVDSLTIRDLTPADSIQARVIALDPNHPKRMLVAINHRDRRAHDAYRLDLVTGDLEVLAENPGDIVEWYADNKLRLRAAKALLPDGATEYRTRDDPDLPWAVLRQEGADEISGGVLGFSPDNKKLWLLTSVGANTGRLVELDLKAGTSRTLASDPQYDLRGVLRHPKRYTLQAANVVRQRSEWDAIDPAIQPDWDKLQGVRFGSFTVLSRDIEDTRWTVQYEVADGPTSYYLYDRVAGRATPLFTDRPALAKYRFAEMRPITYLASDSRTLHAYLTLPPGKEPRNLPLVLLVHGGPWARDVWGFQPEAQFLANRGYAVLQVNYRGSTGYGKDFLNAGDREWAGMMHVDLLDAKYWAVEQGYVDPTRVCMYGASYGGYATLVGLAFTPDDFICGVDLVGPSNLLTLLRTIPPYWAPLRRMFDKRVGNVDTDTTFLRERSPLFKASDIIAPLLIAQGANDPRVKQAESEQIVQALRGNGKEVEYILFSDEGHGLAKPENTLRFYAAMEAFLAKHLKGRAEPPNGIDVSGAR